MSRFRSAVAAVRLRTNAVATGITVALLLAVLLQPGVSAATSGIVSLDAAGLTYNSRTTHLIGAASPCPNPILPTTPTEHNGALEEAGGYVGNVMLPNGSRITGFRVSAEDNDPDVNVYAYLARKRLTTQSGNFLAGYKVLAHVNTAGTQAGIHRIATTSISSAVVDNAQFAYFVELVNCASTVNPAGLQVVYLK